MFNEIDLDLLANILGKTVISAFEDDDITEIIINPDNSLILEGKEFGKKKVGSVIPTEIIHASRLLAKHRDLYLNYENPDLTIRMPEEAPFRGARYHVVIPPVTTGVAVTVRKPNSNIIPLESFLKSGILDNKQFDILVNALISYKNIIVSGQPKSGKTTLTSSLINAIPKYSNPTDRIIVIEDAPELVVPVEDKVYMQTTLTRSMSDLVKNCTRMRPDRIIVGEVIDHGAHALLKSWNLGTPGGITTLHANSTSATPLRLVDLSCELGIAEPINLILETVDVLVHIERGRQYKAGRKVTEIATLKDFNRTTNQFVIEKIH